MARKEQKVEVRCFISIGGAPEVPFESLSEAQRHEIGDRFAEKMAKAIEEYYSVHFDEWVARCEAEQKGKQHGRSEEGPAGGEKGAVGETA